LGDFSLFSIFVAPLIDVAQDAKWQAGKFSYGHWRCRI